MNFSFCLIVKNEEKNIERCLSPIAPLGMEIVIVDTGSTDNTVAIAQKYTQNIYYFEWINDFSAARNFAMEKATNDYVFFLDADEYTESYDLKYLSKMAKDYPDAIGQITRRNLCPGENSDYIYIDPVERFFNRRYYYYTGAIHEQVTRRDGTGLTGYEMNWTVYHEGYYGTPEQLKSKAERNASMLLAELEKTPDDAYIYYQLGQSYGLIKDYSKALYYYEKGVALNPDSTLKYVEIMVINYAQTLRECGRFTEALQLEKSYPSYMENADFANALAQCATGCGNLVKAIKLYKTALKCKRYDTEGTASFLSWYNLGCIYEGLGNISDAQNAFNNALPEYKMAKEKLDSLPAINESKSISIVVAADINEDYSQLLIQSLENQTIGLSNLEIIICLDSKSYLYSSLQDFEKKYENNVMLIKLDDNLSPIQKCVEVAGYASAPYISFITERFIPIPDAFRLLKAGLEISDASLSICVISDRLNYSEEIVDKYSDSSLTPSTICINLNEGANRQLCIQRKIIREPFNGVLYRSDFIFSSVRFNPEPIGSGLSPLEEDIYLNSNQLFIIENICFIRIS